MAAAIVKAVTNFNDADALVEVTRSLKHLEAMPGISVSSLPPEEHLAARGN